MRTGLRCAAGERDGAQLLEQILRANLFLIPLDEGRRWFRYHHLFGELLRHELVRTVPDQVADLHHRAALWYAATVRSWLAALPADLVAAEVPLSVARVWISIDSGRLDEVGAALDAAEASGHVDTHLRVLRALHICRLRIGYRRGPGCAVQIGASHPTHLQDTGSSLPQPPSGCTLPAPISPG